MLPCRALVWSPIKQQRRAHHVQMRSNFIEIEFNLNTTQHCVLCDTPPIMLTVEVPGTGPSFRSGHLHIAFHSGSPSFVESLAAAATT